MGVDADRELTCDECGFEGMFEGVDTPCGGGETHFGADCPKCGNYMELWEQSNDW
jgi:predicted RNA-binding Zn-ribbon protein involved in translation (DUF1610 family)